VRGKRIALAALGVFGLVLAIDAMFGTHDDREMNFVSPVSEANAQTTSAFVKTGRFFRGNVIASDPSVVKDGSRYRMYYTDLKPETKRTVIAVATSNDGLTWTPMANGTSFPGLAVDGRTGMQDENVESAAVVRGDDGSWKLWYSGYRDKGTPMKGFPAALFLAESGDGQNFTRVKSTAVAAPTRGWYDNDAMYSPTIVKTLTGYFAIYVGHAYTNLTSTGGVGGVFLLQATSTDGLTWTKRPTPIVSPGDKTGWMKDGVAEPYLIRAPDGTFLLFFTGLEGEKRTIGGGRADKIDGPWTFNPSPIVTIGKEGSPDEHQVLAPAVLIEGSRIRLWYLAADKKGRLSVGLAEGKWPDSVR
jgi:predicted GH43/DUF377 family glycosyl hydrolase